MTFSFKLASFSCLGKEDITIKISDEGGGIPRSAIPLIWTYMYTTMELGAGGVEENLRDSDFKAPMAGFGYGLPLSRLVSFIDHRYKCDAQRLIRIAVRPIFWW